MTTTNERRDRLRQAILEAFSEVPYPGDTRIVLYPDEYLGSEAQRTLQGRHWRDVVSEAIHECWLVYMWPEARRFYLPAFLLQALDQPPEKYNSSYLFDVVPPEDPMRFAREFDAYTKAQRDAIRRFLECIRDETKDEGTVTLARLALARYWGTASEGPRAPDLTAPPPDTRREQVRQAILKAFADVPYPGDRELAEHPEGQDGPELIRDFKGHGWREVRRGLLNYNYDYLSYFSPEGLRFFIPAYILAGLELRDILFDRSVSTLAPSTGQPELDAWAKARLRVFAPEECRAIRMFLEYVRDSRDGDTSERAAHALAEFWANDPGT